MSMHATPVGPYAGMRFDPDVVDDAHDLLCFGCPACAAAEERWDRQYMRTHQPPPATLAPATRQETAA